METNSAKQAIARSISHTEIVHLDWSPAAHLALTAESEDSTETERRIEFWGTDEDGKEWRGIQPYLKKKMQERRLYPTIEIQKPLTDKTSRARPLQGRMQQGKVTWPSNPPEKVAIVIKELLRFPSGVHDDGVDAMAWVTQLVVNRQPPKPPRPDFGPRPETVAQKIRRLGRGGTGGASAMAA